MLNRYSEILKRPITLLLLYFLVEIMFSTFLLPFYRLQSMEKDGETIEQTSIYYIAVVCVSIITLLVTICLAKYYLKMFKWQDMIKPMRTNVFWTTILVVASLFGIIGLNMISEFADFADMNKDFFNVNSRHVFGLIAACIIAPIGEEILFRGACLGWMKTKGANSVFAILFSSIIFGIMHLNPIQIFFATGFGIILGFLYWYSRSLILPIIVHILNNAISSYTNFVNPDYKISDSFDNFYVALGFSALCFVVCTLSFWKFFLVHKSQPENANI